MLPFISRSSVQILLFVAVSSEFLVFNHISDITSTSSLAGAAAVRGLIGGGAAASSCSI